MSFLSVRNAIKTRWTAQWAGVTPTTYDNTSYTPIPGTPWVRLTVKDGMAAQVSIGGRPTLDRHAGIVFAQVFTPISEGEDRSRWLADKAATVFRKTNVTASDGTLIFGVPYLVSAEEGGDNWWQTNVLCPYTFDEVT